jgi:hypothetical protein
MAWSVVTRGVVSEAMSELMSLRGYAAHRGCALSAVQRAIASGRITPVVDDQTGAKRIDAMAADAQWQRNTDPEQQARALAGRAPNLARKPAAAGGDRREPEPEAGEWMAAKIRRERAAAELLELELKQKAGELVPVADVVKLFGERLRAFRDGVLGVTSRLGDRLVALPDVAAVDAVLRPELEQLLTDLARPVALTQAN